MSEGINPPARVLRDYLYVDVDKVKSIAGQLDSGVPEESRLTRKDATRTTMGWGAFLSYSPESSEEGYVQRSMLDSLFPELEEILEQGWLRDISDEFSIDHKDPVAVIQESRPEGSIFRLTADGYLFDVRHFANLFANFSTTLSGFQEFERAGVELTKSMAAQAAGAPSKKPSPQKKHPRTPGVESATALEDTIEDFAPQFSMSPGFLRGDGALLPTMGTSCGRPSLVNSCPIRPLRLSKDCVRRPQHQQGISSRKSATRCGFDVRMKQISKPEQ